MTEFDGHPFRMTLSGHTGPINSVAVASAGSFLVSASTDATLKLWDPASGEQLRTLHGHTESVWDCAVSLDERLLVSASVDGTLKLWDPASGEHLRTLAGHTDSVSGCAFSPDGAFVVSSSWDGTLKVWDTATGEQLRTLYGHEHAVRDCAVSLDGRLLVSAGGDRTLRLWDPSTGEQLRTLMGHTGWISACVVSPDGSFIVSAGQDKTLKLWDPASGHELGTLEGHLGPVWDCAVSPDGSFIVSASDDGTLKLWDPASRNELITLRGSRCCAVGPDGALVVAGTDEGGLEIWDLTVRDFDDQRGDLDRAMAMYQAQERVSREAGNRERLQTSLGNQALILRARGDLDAAMALFKEQEWICRELGDTAGLEFSLGGQASILHARGDLDGAIALVREQERISRELGNKQWLQTSLGKQALILGARGDLDAAMALFKEQEWICRELGDTAGLRFSLENQALILEAGGELDRAKALLEEVAGTDDAADEVEDVTERDLQHTRKAPHLDEDVQFTVYRPQAIVPEQWYDLLAFAHLSDLPPETEDLEPDPLVEVERQARQLLGEELPEYRSVTHDSVEAVPRASELTFVPEIAGVEFNPPQRSFFWFESVHREEFRLRASWEVDRQTLRGRLTVFLGSVILADIPLTIRVNSDHAPTLTSVPTEVESARPYRKIFASYSHRDDWVVAEFEERANALALGDEYSRDVNTLRTGEIWNERLEDLIREADIFQLFWSWNSMDSRFVEQEWKYALGLGRPTFVRPVYWEEPLPKRDEKDLPPEELRRLHFQRIFPAGLPALGAPAPVGTGNVHPSIPMEAPSSVGTLVRSEGTLVDEPPEEPTETPTTREYAPGTGPGFPRIVYAIGALIILLLLVLRALGWL